MGQGAVMTREQIKRMPEVVAGLLDKQYKLGDIDCLKLFHLFFGQLGIELPQKYKDITFDNYKERWELGELRDEYFEYIRSFSEEVEMEYIAHGDIIIISGADLDVSGIYLGNGHFICCLEDCGVQVMPIKLFTVLEARRINGR